MKACKSKIIIWLIAAIIAGTVFYILLPNYWKRNSLALWIQFGNQLKYLPFWKILLIILFDLILLFRLIASYGLIRLRNWGRVIAICVLSADFLFRLWAFIYGLIYFHTIENSFIPSHLIGALSLILLVTLMRKPIKERFLIR
jgi:hypothetical protein